MPGQSATPLPAIDALSEKEKQTLRLLLAGHDAKSMARHLGLSVHTINERLRDARRKLSVSSSKAAARLLREHEGPPPETIGDKPFGDAAPPPLPHATSRPDETPRPMRNALRAAGGIAMLTIAAAALALTAPGHAPDAARPAQAQAPVQETDAGKAARAFLALIDNADWSGSYAATAESFHALNTLDAWRAASEKTRTPLGRLLSRTLVSESDVPAPPAGVRVVRFRTDYANLHGAVETVSLAREAGAWKVVGVYVS